MAIVLAALALTGCGGKKDDGAKGTGAGSSIATGNTAGSATGSAGATAGSATGTAGSDTAGSGTAGSGDAGSGSAGGVASAASKVDTAAVQAVIDAWLAAQNAGDFAAYSALYSAKFAGIKRAGGRTWMFDRAAWIKDRQRMFKAPMKVTASNVTIGGTATVATVHLEQSYTQGKFHDEGPKSLIVMKTSAGYLIEREEMLHSYKDEPQATTPYYVHAIAGTRRFFVDVAGDMTGRGTLSAVITADDYLHVIADASKTAAGKEWAAKPIKVLDASGTFCEVPVTKVELVSGGYPHFGVFEAWKGDPDDNTKPATEAEKSEHIWAMRQPYVAVQVEEGACKAPVLALPVAAQVHPFPVTTSTEHHEAAIAAFRKLPEWQDQQKEYAGEYAGQGDWEKEAKAVTFSDGMRTFVIVHVQSGDGCGQFYGSLSALFELKGATYKPVQVGGTSSDLVPTAVIQVAGLENVFVVVQDAAWDSPAGIFEWGDESANELGEPLTFPVHDGC